MNRRGVSLIEVMMALTILSTVLIALGGLMFQVGRQTQQAAAATYRTAAVQQGAATVQALAWDDLNGVVGCSADTVGQLEYDRCISVADLTPRTKQVRLVVTPTGNLTALPETLTIHRHRPISRSPLKVH